MDENKISELISVPEERAKLITFAKGVLEDARFDGDDIDDNPDDWNDEELLGFMMDNLDQYEDSL